jgi:hypothetical protein
MDLLFTLRKDLFNGPAFVQAVFGTSLVDLPEPFHAFTSFIHEVIAAQKADKPPPKVRFFYYLSDEQVCPRSHFTLKY